MKFAQALKGRKKMPHPPDANGDVLRRMESQGDDLSRPRDIDFTVVFPDENSAQQFAHHFRGLGYKVSAELTNTAEGFPWDVVVVKHMAASHQEIGAFEDELQRVADNFGGHSEIMSVGDVSAEFKDFG